MYNFLRKPYSDFSVAYLCFDKAGNYTLGLRTIFPEIDYEEIDPLFHNPIFRAWLTKVPL
jgi:ribosomal protein L5